MSPFFIPEQSIITNYQIKPFQIVKSHFPYDLTKNMPK
ncbi:Uncharacterized protein ChrSV_4797 [Chromobacterium vaccinii]|nr:Uncharacterized protein ChrSW_4797 [Chromobacterium vaccinii]QND92252.1 Uncharacterized protein ChrSV_4797 [Chromobacterium vaccinii]